MHGLDTGDKRNAFKKVRDRVIDVRVANAIEAMKNVEEGREKDVLGRQAFKKL